MRSAGLTACPHGAQEDQCDHCECRFMRDRDHLSRLPYGCGHMTIVTYHNWQMLGDAKGDNSGGAHARLCDSRASGATTPFWLRHRPEAPPANRFLLDSKAQPDLSGASPA